MARKKLDEMNNGELYKHYKKQNKVAKVGKFASVVTPFAVIFGAKYNEYIEILPANERYKLTVGCILAIVVGCIALFKELKKNEKFKDILSCLYWGVAFAISYFLYVVTKDLTLILGCEFAGQVAKVGFISWDKYTANESEEYKKLSREDGTLHSHKQEESDIKIEKENSGLI